MTEVPNPAQMQQDPTAGLDGVVAATTRLSSVDGQNGVLILRGRKIEDLAGLIPFEQAIAHLWQDVGPVEPHALKVSLGEARIAAFALVPLLE
ncbi:MAG: citrate/2-methylcitrate synthase, partial [Pseudomonadota bacterium]